ncbi:Sas10/Utp3/C1D family-domain-containing protein [Scheffersomyces xylosifermentans]|uniref:Sas10/Utp3/C1D family-domain-containing protein n=1 Tax=Scheffersomyces xylosifermentans TaxID=1304137 RepID=UPI00315D629D
MENIENVRLFVKAVDNSVDGLEAALEPFLKKSLLELAAEHSNSPKDRIRLYNNAAYTLISVIYSYLKVLGVDTDKHPISQELARIRAYMKRFKDLESTQVSKEELEKRANEKAKEFLQKTLGTKINGGGAAATDNMTSPAISASNFQGKHTKFDDRTEGSDSETETVPKQSTQTPDLARTSNKKSIGTKTKLGKITKPNTKKTSKK